MKKFKQLLCFIIPSVLCWILYFIPSILSYNMINKPSFVVFENYLRLFINDDTFIKALFNSIKIPLVVALVTVTIALVLRCILKKYKYSDLITYSSLSAVNVLLYIINSFLLSIYYEIFYEFNFKVVLMSLEWGVFACFLFWIGSSIIEKIKPQRTYQNTSKNIKNYEWDINTDSLPKRVSCSKEFNSKEFNGWYDEAFIVTKDNKYGIFFYNICEVSMCSYYSALAIFSADNLNAPLIDLKPVDQKLTGRIEGYKRYFYAPLSDCIITICIVNGELPFLLIKPNDKRFALIPFDYTSIYYSVNETEENKLVLEESSPNELKRLKEKGYKSKNGVQFTLHNLTWYNLTEFENIEKIYFNIKGDSK